jgi:hypothetical protein
MRNNGATWQQQLTDLIDNPIVRGFAFALWAVPIYFLLDIQITDQDSIKIQNFIEWFGVPYGLLIALVLVNVWTQFDVTDRAFDHEADAVLKVYDTILLALDSTVITRVCRYLHIYAKHVRKHYHNEFDIKLKKRVGDILLTKLRNSIAVLLRSKADKELAIELLRMVNELIDARGDRLSHSKQRIPTPVFVFAMVTSFIWLMPFFALGFDDWRLSAIFICGVTLVVVSILLIIVDLNDPIGGTWDIHLDAWDDLIDTVR